MRTTRRAFLSRLGAAAALPWVQSPPSGEFAFAHLRYDSGDWDYNPRVAANVLGPRFSARTFRCALSMSVV